MAASDTLPRNASFRRLRQLADLCERQLLECRNGNIEGITQVLHRKEGLIAKIDFADLDPGSKEVQQAALRILQCDSESAEAIQRQHALLGEALRRLQNGRATRRAYGSRPDGGSTSLLLDRRE